MMRTKMRRMLTCLLVLLCSVSSLMGQQADSPVRNDRVPNPVPLTLASSGTTLESRGTDQEISVQIHLIEISASANPTRLRQAAKLIREKGFAAFPGLADQFRNDASVLGHDQLSFEVLNGDEYKYSQKLLRMSFGNQFECGLSFRFKPVLKDGRVDAEFELQKVDLNRPVHYREKHERLPRTVVIERNLNCGPNELVCDVFSDPNRQWMLIALINFDTQE